MNRFKVLVFFFIEIIIIIYFYKQGYHIFIFYIHYLERDKKIVRMLRNIGLLEC